MEPMVENCPLSNTCDARYISAGKHPQGLRRCLSSPKTLLKTPREEYLLPQLVRCRILEKAARIWTRGPALVRLGLQVIRREAPVTTLKNEIAQERPFSGPEEEALLNLLRSADCLERAMQRKIRAWEITLTEYNVLRIRRGSQPQGLTCSAIRDRMITAEPDITRLL